MNLDQRKDQASTIKGTTIIIVENDIDLALVMSQILESIGSRCFIATNAIEGLEQCLTCQEELSLVIFDLNLSDMSGLEFFKLATKINQYAAGVVLADQNKTDTLSDVLKLGAIDFILKPFNPDEIIDKVEAWLEVARRERKIKSLEKQKSTTIST